MSPAVRHFFQNSCAAFLCSGSVVLIKLISSDKFNAPLRSLNFSAYSSTYVCVSLLFSWAFLWIFNPCSSVPVLKKHHYPWILNSARSYLPEQLLMQSRCEDQNLRMEGLLLCKIDSYICSEIVTEGVAIFYSWRVAQGPEIMLQEVERKMDE